MSLCAVISLLTTSSAGSLAITVPLNLVAIVIDAWLTVDRNNDGPYFNCSQIWEGAIILMMSSNTVH